MAKQSSNDTSSRKLTTPASVAFVVVGTYGAVVALLLLLYFFLNLGIPAGSPRYRAAPAFTMGVFGSAMVTYSNISPNFKQLWVFSWCFVFAMFVSCVSVPLHFFTPDFIEWYIGPLVTGLWGGFALTIIYVVKRMRHQTTDESISANGQEHHRNVTAV